MPQQPAAAVRVPSGGASGKVGSGHSTYCATHSTYYTTSPGGHRRRARCQALRRRPALPGALPPSQPPLLPPSPPPAQLPRATRLYLFRAVLTIRTRSRRPCTRLTSTPPRCSSQRWPAFAGPSRVAEKAAGIWPQGAVDCQSSSRASPEATPCLCSVLRVLHSHCHLVRIYLGWYAFTLVGWYEFTLLGYYLLTYLLGTAHTCPRMSPLPACGSPSLAFGERGGGCILGAGDCLRPVWLSQRLK